MNKQEFINTCHAAQHDAGSQTNFNQVITKAETICRNGELRDPVAAFIAALLVDNDGNVDATKEAMAFWGEEMTRVLNAFKS
jgi:hypothetical protein